jgi:uncharacterized membrane protein
VTRAITGDVSGALADLGILVPLTAALVVVNGLDVGSVLLLAGLLVVSAGLVFRIPFPVQPLKALTALAVAQSLAPDVIHAAGLEIGLVLMLMSLTGLATLMSKLFTKPVVRALQFGVGWLLVVTAVKLVVNPPAVFVNSPSSQTGLLLAAATILRLRWVHRRGQATARAQANRSIPSKAARQSKAASARQQPAVRSTVGR